MSANMETFPFSGRSKVCGWCGERIKKKGQYYQMQFRDLEEVRHSMESGQITEWRREHHLGGCKPGDGCPGPWMKRKPWKRKP